MTRIFAFNGDADGLTALQQLRLAEPGPATLVTGVKRDISLLERVEAAPGDECTVLDVSLDTNRAGLERLLEQGVRVRYFDHHYAGAVPDSSHLTAHLDPSPDACTSLIVDRFLAGRSRSWAVAGAFGDGLMRRARELSESAGLAPDAIATLEELGVCLNYNAYGETIADLHLAPAELADKMLAYDDAVEFARASEDFARLRVGYRDDMEHGRRLTPVRQAPGARTYLLPDAPWARRVSGVLANELAAAQVEGAIALVSPKKEGGYLVSVRVPATARVTAEEFCRRFPTGGGRRTAAGINHLPSSEFESFAADFEAAFAKAS